MVDKDTGPTTWLATTATLHERTMLAKASHGRTAPKAKSKMAVSDLFMNKAAANAQDEHLLKLLAQGLGDIDAS